MALSTSSLEVLLTGLEDVSTALASPAIACATLAQLLVVCRVDEPRQELLFGGGLDVLADFAAEATATAAVHEDVAVALLELVATLACDRSRNARARLVDKSSLLSLPHQCLRLLSTRKPGKKRHRLMRIALELLAQFSATDTAGRREDHGVQTVAVLLRVLENPQDDAALLQHAVELLTSCMVKRRSSVHTAAGLNAVAILLRILDTQNTAMEDLTRRVCEALLVIGSEREFVPLLAANNAIHSVARCLRMHSLPSQAETLALKLLLLLCDGSQVFGHVIHEDLLPVLFEVLAQRPSTEATSAICRVLEGVATFAMGCKLDLAAFVNAAPACQGIVLVRAVATRSLNAGSVFRFFATILQNATELPQLINNETLEGLLSLYMVQGDASKDSSCELGTHMATIVARLSPSTIETLVLANEDESLPALFLCLRGHSSDITFAANTYTILLRLWGSRNREIGAQSLAGFISIAVEILLEQCTGGVKAPLLELLNVYRFLREMLLSGDGGAVVQACGGLSLARALDRRFPKRPETATMTATVAVGSHSLLGSSTRYEPKANSSQVQVEQLAHEIITLLNNVIASSVNDSKVGVERLPSPDGRTPSLSPSSSNSALVDDDEAEAGDPNDDDANDDGSDADGEAEMVCEENQGYVSGLQRLSVADGGDPCASACSGVATTYSDRVTSCGAVDSGTEPTASAPLHIEYSSTVLQRVNFATLRESPYVYVDEHGVQYPRHPSRSSSPTGSGDETSLPQSNFKLEGFSLFQEPPLHPEPCKPSDAPTRSVFVEQASRRRDDFVAADPQTRARLVYENTAVYRESRHGVTTEGRGFTSCVSGGSPYPYEVSETSKAFNNTPGLTFDSWFESGNLERAIQIGDFEYDLVLRRDLHTTGHTQWFYFAVSNVPTTKGSPRGLRYRFNIINLCKPDSLFNQGLRPVVYSVRDADERRVGWRRSGEDVYYFPNPFTRATGTHAVCNDNGSTDNNNPTAETTTPKAGKVAATYFTLTFTLDFHNTEDTYLVAHSYPFTFSDHQRHLQRLLHQHRANRRRTPQILKHSVLCTTLEGRPCDLLTISDFSVGSEELLSRRAVVLTARVHPGESQASWIMRGVIDFLVGTSETARVLRRLFVFQIVPMLNPDGVVHGNSRCSLSACDLNRQWQHPSPQLHPTVFHTKQLLATERATRGLLFFCDLHGHSRKKNVFMYGCDTKKRPNPMARFFARLFSTQPTAKRLISYVDCSFKVSKDKETTARVVVAKEFQLSWCFTLEASFGGANFGDLQDVHFNTTHLGQVGSGLCETLLQASITDVALRDTILSLVDDYSVSLAATVEDHLWEAGVVSVSHATGQPPAQTPRKDKGALEPAAKPQKETAVTKRRRRRTLGALPEEERKATALNTASKPGRRLAPKRAGTMKMTRRKSSPPTTTALEGTEFKAAEQSRKREGRGRRRLESNSCTEAPPVGSLTKPRGKPLFELLGSFEPPDEEDTQLYRLQSMVRGANGGAASAGGLSLPKPEALPRAFPPAVSSPSSTSSILVHRRLTATSRHMDEPNLPASSHPQFATNDAVPPVLLPPPVSDLLLARSPKPPSKLLRFKGCGRQYAALTTSPRPPRQDDLMKSGSMASTVGFEPELIQASTISLKQRLASPPTTKAAPEAEPLSFKASRLAATSTATFSSSLLPRHSLA